MPSFLSINDLERNFKRHSGDILTKLVCTSCSSNIIASEPFVRFSCPSCAEADIVRCSRCKNASNNYTCPKCGFVGP
ncbi:MAG: RNA-binding protein [Candidatus Aenigmarchaeota archaeon]|nr:RNA-binding protein [Candidatus Aenigmarchaeota archaeon]